MKRLSTPILFVIFRRKETSLKIIDVIGKVKPRKLYIFQDGPRSIEEKKEVLETRKAVLSKINWECKVYKKFMSKNLGVKWAEIRALNWLFSNEDRVIFLEDDNLPNEDFFYFQEELLERYADDERILAINGINFYSEKTSKLGDKYFLSKFFVPWGFGMWRRSWKLFDLHLKDYELVRRTDEYKRRFINFWSRFYLESYWGPVSRGIFNTTWDFSFEFLAFKYDKYVITPPKNMVVNLCQDFGGSNPFIWKDFKELEKLSVIKHPRKLIYDKRYDEIYFKNRLRGGAPRLIAIRIYNYLPDKTRHLVVKVLKYILR